MAELSHCKESRYDPESLKYLLYGPSKKKSVNPCFRGGIMLLPQTDSDLAFICWIRDKILNLKSSLIFFLWYWPKKHTTVSLPPLECPNIESRWFLQLPDPGEGAGQGFCTCNPIIIGIEWWMHKERKLSILNQQRPLHGLCLSPPFIEAWIAWHCQQITLDIFPALILKNQKCSMYSVIQNGKAGAAVSSLPLKAQRWLFRVKFRSITSSLISAISDGSTNYKALAIVTPLS